MQLFSWNTELLTNTLTASSTSVQADSSGCRDGGGGGGVDWERTPQPIVKLFYEDLLLIEPAHRQQ